VFNTKVKHFATRRSSHRPGLDKNKPVGILFLWFSCVKTQWFYPINVRGLKLLVVGEKILQNTLPPPIGLDNGNFGPSTIFLVLLILL
jgi:hypothetical protein